MWTVSFNEYLYFDQVKDNINRIKELKKEQRKTSPYMQHGQMVEDMVFSILSNSSMDIKPTTPQMDIGFGADALVSYKDGDKNRSFYMDITSHQGDHTQYLSLFGTPTANIKEAYAYTTEYGKFYIGIKERHMNWFFYEKPVIVLYTENFIPSTGMACSHISNIEGLLKAANGLLMTLGYSPRASKMLRPNLNRYRAEYQKQ